MDEANQSTHAAPATSSGVGTPPDAPAADVPGADAPGGLEPPVAPFGMSAEPFVPPPIDVAARPEGERALVGWLALVLLSGIAGFAFGLPELGALCALAGILAVSHAADLDRRWLKLHGSLAWTVPVGG